MANPNACKMSGSPNVNVAGALGGEGAAAAELSRLREELAAAQQRLEECDRCRREHQKREAALRHELQRRVRNTLALVRSVFARTVQTGQSLEDIDSHFRGRLDVLASYQGPSLGGRHDLDFEWILRDQLNEFQFGDIPGITIDGPDVRINADQAQPLALAIHELVTNALKFGALSVKEATLSITWDIADDVLQLVWAEAGVPDVLASPSRTGFSRQFIEEALPYQTGAETRFELRPGGLLCLIHLPLRRNNNAENTG